MKKPKFVLVAAVLALRCAVEAGESSSLTVRLPPPAAVLVYKTIGARSLHLYIDRPEGWRAGDRRPAFVFLHGGAWVGGNAETARAQTLYFSRRGMVGISVEYRLLARGSRDAPTICCQDAKSALRYVRAHGVELGIDSERIAGSGGSAGGHLVAFAAMVAGQDDPHDDLRVSPQPNALVLFNPVLDNGPKSAGGWGNERVGTQVTEFSPAHNVHRGVPPMILFLGRNDALVPVATLERFQARLQAVGTRCDLFLYEGLGHGFFNREPYTSETLREADKFLVTLGWTK